MNSVKTCPLCGSQRWKSDGKFVLEQADLAAFTLDGLSLAEIRNAIRFAENNGWKARGGE